MHIDWLRGAMVEGFCSNWKETLLNNQNLKKVLTEKERDQLKSELERVRLKKQLAENSLKDKYETQIKS